MVEVENVTEGILRFQRKKGELPEKTELVARRFRLRIQF